MFASVLIALGLQSAAPAAAEPLAWMEGDWICYAVPPSGSGPRSFEEYWVRNRHGTLVGVGRVWNFRTRSLEHMRIAPGADGRLTFYGAPDGAAPVAFPLARRSENEVVFENPAHDFPQRVTYRHEPNSLIATVSRIDGSDAQSWRYSNLPIAAADGDRAPCRAPEAAE